MKWSSTSLRDDLELYRSLAKSSHSPRNDVQHDPHGTYHKTVSSRTKPPRMTIGLRHENRLLSNLSTRLYAIPLKWPFNPRALPLCQHHGSSTLVRNYRYAMRQTSLDATLNLSQDKALLDSCAITTQVTRKSPVNGTYPNPSLATAQRYNYRELQKYCKILFLPCERHVQKWH